MKYHICLLALIMTLEVRGEEGWEIQLLPTNVNLSTVVFPHPDTGYIFGDSGTVLKTNNSGDTWFAQPSGLQTHLSNAQFLTPRLGWVIGNGSTGDTLYRTTDGGEHWQALTGASILFSTRFVNIDTGYIVKAANADIRIYQTLDGGLNWTLRKSFSVNRSPSRSEHHFRLSIIDKRTAWSFGGENWLQSYPTQGPGGPSTHGTVVVPFTYRTENIGVDWSEISGITGSRGRPRDAYFWNKDTGWVVGGDAFYSKPTRTQLLKTTDGGTTWNAGTDFTRILNSVHFRGKDTGYSVGQDGLILKTTTGGTTWASRQIPSLKTLNSVAIISSTRAFAVGIDGTLMRGDVTFPTTGQQPLRIRTPFAVLNEGLLHYMLSSATSVSLTVMDARGKVLLTIKKTQAPGERSLKVPTEHLSPGVYLLDLRAGGFRETFRLKIP